MRFLLVLLILVSSLGAREKASVKKSFARQTREEIEKVLGGREKQGRVGAALYSCKTKRHLYKKNNEQLFRTGEHQRIITSIAALSMLGPRFAFVTHLSSLGAIQGAILHGDLYLQLSGDPFFSAEQLVQLFRAAKRKGIETVEGNFYFDGFGIESFEGALAEAGIRVTGKVIREKRGEGTVLIAEHRSPPLEEMIAAGLQREEERLYEALFKQMGGVEEFFEREVGLCKGSFCFVDGSGKSFLNRISPSSFLSILSWMPRNFPCREQLLSVRQGSSSTGSSLIGTIETKDGEKVLAAFFFEDFFLPHRLEEEIIQTVGFLARIKK